jgi:acetylornithine deacetylase/succinyl-diaminopimelate desuccinylase-like protein
MVGKREGPTGSPGHVRHRSGYTGAVQIAAIAVAALMLACAPGGPPAEAPMAASATPDLGQRAADILSQAIRIVTVNPPGDEKPLAAYFVALMQGAGLEAAVIETPSGDSTVGRGAAWGMLRGSGKRRPIVLLSHLDVVPADSAAWESDPFAGHRVDASVVGRGAIDAKGAAVVQLLTLTELARRGTTLERDVIFLATPDEETGGLDGAAYFTREHPELLRDAAFLLTEGGGVLIGEGDERPIWGVAVTEKNPCWLRVISRGTPGHSSVPPRDAAVPRLIAALERVQRIETPVRVVPTVEDMFATLAPLVAEEDRAGFAALAENLESDPAFRNRFLFDRQHAALVRTTFTTTVLEGSSRTNVVPPTASAHIDARLLPGESCAAFADQIRRVVADPGIDAEILLTFPSLVSTTDSAIFQAIGNVARKTDPDALVVPRMIAGFTDAHYFRSLGIASYGFVPRWLRAGEARGVHGHNEQISIANLERGVVTMIEILQELDRVEASR